MRANMTLTERFIVYLTMTTVMLSATLGQIDELEKRDLRALLDEQCPLQCRGEVTNTYLERMCTCVYRPGTFIFGKRNGGFYDPVNGNLDGGKKKLMRNLLARGTTQEERPPLREQIQRLLQEAVSTSNPPPTPNVFISEFGKSVQDATHEDFMDWTEKEMKAAELRLLKLIRFYDFIRKTALR